MKFISWLLLLTLLLSGVASADPVAKDENVLLGITAVESAVDSIETRYFLTHGSGFCPPVYASIPIIGQFQSAPPGAVCTYVEGDTLARPFVNTNRGAIAGFFLANIVVNAGVRGLDAIPTVRHSHAVIWALAAGLLLETFNVGVHNAFPIAGQIRYQLTK